MRFFDILVNYRQYIVLILLSSLALIFVANNDTREVRRLRAFATASLGLFQSSFAWIPNPIALERENKTLRELTVDLAAEVGRLRSVQTENKQLRDLLELKDRSQFHLLTADVLGKTTTMFQNTITLDVGSMDGVSAEMPVVASLGLVGKILTASDHYSVVQIMLNRDFRASAKVERSRVDGIIYWEGGNNVLLKNVGKSLSVDVGDRIVTSEYSNIYPPNILIGWVESVNDEPNTLFKKIVVKPAVDFFTLEAAMVVLATPAVERKDLERSVKTP